MRWDHGDNRMGGRMRIGCSTITFGPQSIEEAFERIADLGFRVIDLSAVPGVFDHVNLIDPPAEEIGRIASLVDRYGFEVAGLLSVPWIPDALDDAVELRRRYTFAADVAKAVGARAWVVDGNRPDTPDASGRAKGLERFRRTITMAADLAHERGIAIAIEAPHGGTLAETLPEAIELLEVADIPELGIDFDTSHVLNSGATTSEMLDAIGDRVIHVALRDARVGGHACTPGDGDVDFAELFRLLITTGYNGDVLLELEPAAEDASAEERGREAVRARGYLEPLLVAAGNQD
ncbi:sugar phosphate isomerase/epimerase family protein [Jiangella anatolica]|nr:sugar phosphate isomerase/epimerase [Jiangella anatolica]